jgi:hypothetical protein
MNIDEVDFYDNQAKSPAFMHLRKADDGISVEFALVNHEGFEMTVSIKDARRLGERLTAAANEVAAE